MPRDAHPPCPLGIAQPCQSLYSRYMQKLSISWRCKDAWIMLSCLAKASQLANLHLTTLLGHRHITVMVSCYGHLHLGPFHTTQGLSIQRLVNCAPLVNLVTEAMSQFQAMQLSSSWVPHGSHPGFRQSPASHGQARYCSRLS